MKHKLGPPVVPFVIRVRDFLAGAFFCDKEVLVGDAACHYAIYIVTVSNNPRGSPQLSTCCNHHNMSDALMHTDMCYIPTPSPSNGSAQPYMTPLAILDLGGSANSEAELLIHPCTGSYIRPYTCSLSVDFPPPPTTRVMMMQSATYVLIPPRPHPSPAPRPHPSHPPHPPFPFRPPQRITSLGTEPTRCARATSGA